MRRTEQLEKLLRHVELVRDNGVQLAKKLMDQGEDQFARQLIANVLQHDVSKFLPGEWESLCSDNQVEEELTKAVHRHNHTNAHHPEYWGSIHAMPRLYIAEMVCDWKARSTEFGTSLTRDWIDSGAQTRFSFTKDDEVYTQIMSFVNLLLEKPFKQLTTSSAEGH